MSTKMNLSTPYGKGLSIPRTTVALETLNDADLLEFFLLWEDGMISAFNGRDRVRVKGTFKMQVNCSYTLNGKHCCFEEVEKYVKLRGLGGVVL